MKRLVVCGVVLSTFLTVAVAGTDIAQAAVKSALSSASSAPTVSPVTLSGSAGEWTYRCIFPSSAPNAAPNVCLAEQRLMMQDAQKQTIPLGGVILARATDDAVKNPLSSRPWRLTLMTPLGLSLQQAARLVVGKEAPLTLAWQSCVSSGCLSTLDLTAAQVDMLQHGQTGHIEVNKLAGGVLTINFTLNGIDSALRTVDGWIARSQSAPAQ
ncbi:invasion associated locus B family protein [Acetobacter sp. P5B1]|uniref:invasion associated locus B family protein n=1 Tax=Acetobacter sp. P5B1 TaxID=2762620 RepID=UPI001C0594A2|nr:invasion associated locus B family protein [Acetobacter sp. P5B1]